MTCWAEFCAGEEAAAVRALCRSRATCWGAGGLKIGLVPVALCPMGASVVTGTASASVGGALSLGVGGVAPGNRGRATLHAKRFFCTEDSTDGMLGMRCARAEMAWDTLSYSHSQPRTAARPSMSTSMARGSSPAVSSSLEVYTQNRDRERTSGTSLASCSSTCRAASTSPNAAAARASFTFETRSSCMLRSRAEITFPAATCPLLAAGFDTARRRLAAETFRGTALWARSFGLATAADEPFGAESTTETVLFSKLSSSRRFDGRCMAAVPAVPTVLLLLRRLLTAEDLLNTAPLSTLAPILLTLACTTLLGFDTSAT